MVDEPLVSIALCTYNGEKYLGQQLDSLLLQTYGNLEIVIVDDCSTDRTFEIVGNYAQKDRRIKYFKNEINLGFNKNFERAIGITTGEYIAISDQDDIWLPNKIEELLGRIANDWLIFSNSIFINDNNEVLDGEMLHTDNIAANKDMYNYKSLLLTNFVTGHTTLFKREFMDYFLPFPEKGFYDWWMGFIAVYHQKIVFFNEVLTHYRIHETSVTKRGIRTREQKRKNTIVVDHMLSALATYKNLKDKDIAFIATLRDGYRLNLYKRSPFLLIKIILNNYRELFFDHKNRSGLSLLNFAIKYARKTRKSILINDEK